jgi:hypothetical protein
LKRHATLCAACQARKARFRYRGDVRADRDHTLCFECFRREANRARARRLMERSAPPRVRSSFGQHTAGGRLLDQRQLAHRRRMLDHLQGLAGAAS